MKLSFLLGAAAGYVLGARAGRERYEAIVATARKISGSQTVQSTAGVLQAQADDLVERARQEVGRLLSHSGHGSQSGHAGTNGHKPVD